MCYDALGMKFTVTDLKEKNPDCEVCGSNPKIKDFKAFDYEEFCQTNKPSKYELVKLPAENNVTPKQFFDDYISKLNTDIA